MGAGPRPQRTGLAKLLAPEIGPSWLLVAVSGLPPPAARRPNSGDPFWGSGSKTLRTLGIRRNLEISGIPEIPGKPSMGGNREPGAPVPDPREPA